MALNPRREGLNLAWKRGYGQLDPGSRQRESQPHPDRGSDDGVEEIHGLVANPGVLPPDRTDERSLMRPPILLGRAYPLAGSWRNGAKDMRWAGHGPSRSRAARWADVP